MSPAGRTRRRAQAGGPRRAKAAEPPDLLLEIGAEEIPASFVPAALRQLEEDLAKALGEARLAHGEVRAVGTPRRLAVWARGVAQRQPVRLEEQPHERTVCGIGHPGPHGSQPRPSGLRLGAAPKGSDPVPHCAEDLFDEAFLRAEMMEENRRLRPERLRQGAQREIGNPVGDHVVDGPLEEFPAALRVGRSGHYPNPGRWGRRTFD